MKMLYFSIDSEQIKNIELSEKIASFLKLEPRLDDYTRDQIERFLRKRNQIYDFSFNKNILELGEKSLKLVLEKFLSEKDVKEIYGKIQKDIAN
ncbi:MAG: hypothetical protein ABDH59_09205 [Fervidobacterium sp.]